MALQAGARPFESAVDRFDGRVQHVGHLVFDAVPHCPGEHADAGKKCRVQVIGPLLAGRILGRKTELDGSEDIPQMGLDISVHSHS